MATDAEIRAKGIKYLPLQKYLQNPYEFPTEEETAPPQDGGITNTNAFTNSGGNDNFNPDGNAFGYGSQIEPGGSYGSYDSINYTGGLPGDVQQYGVGRQFEDPSASPIGETYSYKKEVPGFMRLLGGFVPGGNFLLNAAEKKMNANRDQPSGTYGIAGLSDAQKGYYDNLAGSGMLFNGPNGIKTLTGKNFNAKNYAQGQIDIYNKKGYDKYTVEDDDVYDAGGKKLTGFLKKQYQEASAMYKTTEKQKKEAEEQKKQEEETKAAAQKKQQTREAATADRARAANSTVYSNADAGGFTDGQGGGFGSKSTGTNENFSNNSGKGRTGYFFGGRVNYKVGGVVHPDGRKGFFKGAQADTSKGESMSPGTDASGGFRGGDNDGGASDNPPVTVVNNNPIDISTVTKSVGDYEIPYGVEALLANRGKFKAVINPDEILDKNLGAEFTYDNGPFSIGAYADMDGDKSLNANYTRNNSNYSFDLNDDGGQLKFTRTFANGGLAGLL